MSISSRYRLAIIFVALAALALILILRAPLLWFTGSRINPPSDQELLHLFQQHRAEFDTLRTMAGQDSSRLRYFSLSTLRSSGLSKDRQRGYTDLLTRIDPNVAIMEGGDWVKFRLAGEDGSLAIASDWRKGVEYIEGDASRQGLVRPNLDDLAKLAPGVYLRPIEAKWFLFFESDD